MPFEYEEDQNVHQCLEIKTEKSEFEQDPNILSNQEISIFDFKNVNIDVKMEPASIEIGM